MATRYGLLPDNLENLKSLRGGMSQRIAVAPFTSEEPGKGTIMCRGLAPVEAPNGKSFEVYLREALVSELKVAEIFDEKSPNILQGRLDDIDFSSNVGTGNWTIKITFSSLATKPFTVQHTYPFSASFVGDIACGQVAQALMPATQDFYGELYNHMSFKQLLTHH